MMKNVIAMETTQEDLDHYAKHLESISPEAYEKRLGELQAKHDRAMELLKELLIKIEEFIK